MDTLLITMIIGVVATAINFRSVLAKPKPMVCYQPRSPYGLPLHPPHYTVLNPKGANGTINGAELLRTISKNK
jgi:hypothetical protein